MTAFIVDYQAYIALGLLACMFVGFFMERYPCLLYTSDAADE